MQMHIRIQWRPMVMLHLLSVTENPMLASKDRHTLCIKHAERIQKLPEISCSSAIAFSFIGRDILLTASLQDIALLLAGQLGA